jgi:hypothetical protein
MWASLGILLVVQFMLENDSQSRLLKVIKDINPNFIAALVAALLVYYLLRDFNYERYLSALRPVRATLRDEKLTSETTRKIMRGVVSAASTLYFGKPHPEVPRKDLGVNKENILCNTCNESCPIKGGSCPLCFDIVDSWQANQSPAGVRTDQPGGQK